MIRVFLIGVVEAGSTIFEFAECYLTKRSCDMNDNRHYRNQRLRFDKPFASCGIVMLLATGVSMSDERETRLPATTTVAFRVARHGDRILVPVTTLGKERAFLLNTGAPIALYDTSLESQLTKIGIGETPGEPDFPIYETPSASIGPFKLCNSPIVAGNLRRIRETSGEPLFGVIGMNDLSKMILQIDFDEGLCRFTQTINGDLGESIDLLFDEEGFPMAKVRLNSISTADMKIDTGFSSDCALSAKLFDTLTDNGDITLRYRSKFLSLAGTESRQIGSLKTISLGKHTHTEVSVARTGDSNLVGLGYLSRYLGINETLGVW